MSAARALGSEVAGRLELKVRIDMDLAPAGRQGPESLFLIRPVVKVGNDWKLGASRSYDDAWDQDGQAQPSAQ